METSTSNRPLYAVPDFQEGATHTNLFGEQVEGDHSYSREAAAEQADYLQNLVGQILVETAVKVQNTGTTGQEIAGELTSDAKRYMEAWGKQAEFNQLIAKNRMDQTYMFEMSRVEEDEEKKSGSSTTSKTSTTTKDRKGTAAVTTIWGAAPLRDGRSNRSTDHRTAA